jgi:hypothetical protein
MPVFISHRKNDVAPAMAIYTFLKNKNITCYIDELDETLLRSENITGKIMERIKACTHMIAVMSTNTRGSWWVPFEIGVASEADRRITSYKIDGIAVPEYLEIWPVMTTQAHLEQFAYYYKNDKSSLSESSDFSVRQTAAYASIRTAADFHGKLKTAIRGY